MKMPMKPTPAVEFHILALRTNWVEQVMDDGLVMVNAIVDNGDFNKEEQNNVTLKLVDQRAELGALQAGGLAIFSNLKKNVLRNALLTGVDYLMRTGQLSQEDFNVVAQATDSDEESGGDINPEVSE